ncbi:pilus assembly protein N-terminal domain-containing protein [Planctomycetota bacterium]
MNGRVLALGLLLVSLNVSRVCTVYADDSKPQTENGQEHHGFANTIPTLAGPASERHNVLHFSVAKHSVDLEIGSHRIVRFDVPVDAVRPRNNSIVNAIRADASSVELIALKRGSTEVEVTTPKNGTIVLHVKVLAPAERLQQVTLKVQVLEINADKATVDNTLDELFPSTVAIADGRAYVTTGDAERVKEQLAATPATMVATPTLATVSGRPAGFKIGGEVPLSVPQGPGKIAVEYLQFGTRVDLVPLVLSDQRLRLNIQPSVRTLKAAQLGRTEIPSFHSRWVETATEMSFNEVAIVAMVDAAPDNEGKQHCLITTVQPAIGVGILLAETPQP